MDLLSFDMLSFFAFLAILALLIIKDRKKVKREGIVLIRRTKKGRDFIDKTAKKNPRLWNYISFVGIVVSTIGLIFVSVILISNAFNIITGVAEGGVRLLLPGPVSTPVLTPVVFVVPWWIWIIGVISLMIPHEFSHGIMCRLEKIKIKSVGWLLLFVIPGAFVEPDEKQLQKSKKPTQLKVYAAGSFANITIALIIVALFMTMFPLMFAPTGVFIQTVENSSANMSGMRGSLIEIGSDRIRNTDDISFALSKYKPGDSVAVKTVSENYFIPYLSFSGSNLIEFIAPKYAIATDFNETNEYILELTEHPDYPGTAYMGIIPAFETYSTTFDIRLYATLAVIIIWIYIFNLFVGLINLLPIKPLDGGLMFEVYAKKLSKRSKTIVKFVSFTMLFVLIFNLIGPLIMGMF